MSSSESSVSHQFSLSGSLDDLYVYFSLSWRFLFFETLSHNKYPPSLAVNNNSRLGSPLKRRTNTVYYSSLYEQLINASKLKIWLQFRVEKLMHTELCQKLQNWKISNTVKSTLSDNTQLPVAQWYSSRSQRNRTNDYYCISPFNLAKTEVAHIRKLSRNRHLTPVYTTIAQRKTGIGIYIVQVLI
jgi:hypothetical protein